MYTHGVGNIRRVISAWYTALRATCWATGWDLFDTAIAQHTSYTGTLYQQGIIP